MKKLLLTLSLAIACYSSLFAQWTNLGSNIYPLTLTNNVGIGTSSPNSLLTVGSSSIRGTVNVIGSTTSPPVVSLSDSQSGGRQYSLYNGLNPGNLDIFDQAASAIRLSIASSGNVGIGDINPAYKLTVNSQGNTTNASSVFHGAYYGSAISSGQSSASYYALNVTGGASAPGSGTSLFYVRSDGNIGISNTSPYFKLQVESGVRGVAKFGSSLTGNTGNISISNASNYAYGVMGVVSGTGGSDYDVYGLGYSSNANSSFNNVLNWTSTGRIGIGTTTPDEKLTVNGIIHSTEVKVTSTVPVPDYVFDPQYKLTELTELKEYLDKNHHLPEIPSAKTIEKDGINLGDMNLKLLKKVEELTLYLIEKDNQLRVQAQNNQSQQDQINELKQQLAAIAQTLTK